MKARKKMIYAMTGATSFAVGSLIGFLLFLGYIYLALKKHDY
jgi:hypothetical protein